MVQVKQKIFVALIIVCLLCLLVSIASFLLASFFDLWGIVDPVNLPLLRTCSGIASQILIIVIFWYEKTQKI